MRLIDVSLKWIERRSNGKLGSHVGFMMRFCIDFLKKLDSCTERSIVVVYKRLGRDIET